MSAMNPVPSSGSSTEKRSYEPSMEEILASIRRIIADDQSLPGRGVSAREQEPPADPPPQEASPAAPRYGSDPQVIAPRSPTPEAEQPESELHDSHAGSSAVESSSAIGLRQDSVARPSPIQWASPELVDDVQPEPRHEPENASAVDSAMLSASPAHHEHPIAHGAIAAPQYAGPAGLAYPDDAVADDPQEPEPMSPAHDRFEEPSEPPPPRHLPERQPLFSSATDTSVSSAFNVLAASRLAANSDEIMNLVHEMLRPLLRNWLDDNLPSMVERMVRDEIERVARGGR